MLQRKISIMVDNLFTLTFWEAILQRLKWAYCGFGIYCFCFYVPGFWEVRFMVVLEWLGKLCYKALALRAVLF